MEKTINREESKHVTSTTLSFTDSFTVEDIISIIKNKEEFLPELAALANKLDLTYTYEKNTNGRIIRVLLRIKKNSNVHPLVYYSCNGCVIDTVNWRVVSMPPLAFNKQHIYNIVDKFLMQDMYDIFKVVDGTIVTFYYWGNKWNIASSNGYDVSSYYWIGDLTYAEVIHDLFSRLYPDAIEQNGIKLIDNYLLDFNLDTNHCYTIGFRHHNFHPLLLDPECMWNVQHVNLTTKEVTYGNGLLGIPNQTSMTLDKTTKTTSTTNDTPVKLDVVWSVDQLMSINKLSINNATKLQPSFNYGYILRSKDASVTKQLSNVLIESPLLRKIKKHVYEYPSNLFNQFINNKNRTEYIIIKNYFNKQEKNDIIQLYPQFSNVYTLLSKCISDTIACMIIIMKNKQANTNEQLPYKPCITILSYTLLKYITKYEAIDPFSKDIESILRDYITNIEYVVLFINTINKYN
jgi:hypothetical protein